MSDKQRQILRLKQDFLLMLAARFDQRLAVTEGGPRLEQLREYIYPEWENYVDHQIKMLAKEQNIGVPDFAKLTPLTR